MSFWTVRLPHGAVAVTTKQLGDHYLCEMNHGAAVCGGNVAAVALKPILARLGLDKADLVSGISAKVVSTGLPYLIVPVRPAALARAAIQGSDLESLLGTIGAKFVLVLDIERPEIRTWDNLDSDQDASWNISRSLSVWIRVGQPRGCPRAWFSGKWLAQLLEHVIRWRCGSFGPGSSRRVDLPMARGLASL